MIDVKNLKMNECRGESCPPKPMSTEVLMKVDGEGWAIR